MQKWELTYYIANVSSFGTDLDKIYKDKDKRTKRTQWESIQDIAAQGWELVSVTSITEGGTFTATAGGNFTTQLLYTFKRPC